MIFVAPDLLTPTLLVLSLSFLLFGFLIMKNRRKTVAALLISITLIVGVYQTTLNNDLLALDQGEILGVGFFQSE